MCCCWSRRTGRPRRRGWLSIAWSRRRIGQSRHRESTHAVSGCWGNWKGERERTYSKIELSTADIVTGIGGLHNHSLAFDLGIGEGEFVAGATGRVVCCDGGETVGEVVIDGPRGLGGAHE